MLSHFISNSIGQCAMVFDISRDIVDVIVAELAAVMQKQQKQRQNAKERALEIFRLKKPEDEQEATMYTAIVPKTKLNVFDLTIRYVSCGTSFPMASRTTDKTNEVLANLLIRSCPPSLVSTFVRVVFAVNLDRISKLFQDSQAFSLGLDSATHQSTSYLVIRARVFCEAQCDIVNAYVAALPMHERHTGRAMF
eukprot:IDg21586t1